MPDTSAPDDSPASPPPLPFVRTVVHRSVVDSTNTLARSLLGAGGLDLPLLVWADSQTQGRGRGDRDWWSDDGSLTFTIGLDPDVQGLRVDQEPMLALATAVAVIESVLGLGLAAPGIGIRWPNDVEASGRKLCGILPERLETKDGRRVLVGVGLNVSTHLDQAPAEIQGMAASLNSLQSRPLDPSALPRILAAILAHFDDELRRLSDEDPNLPKRWNNLNLLRDQVVRVALGPRVLEGRVVEIDARGALLVHDGQRIHRLFGGQVLRTSP